MKSRHYMGILAGPLYTLRALGLILRKSKSPQVGFFARSRHVAYECIRTLGLYRLRRYFGGLHLARPRSRLAPLGLVRSIWRVQAIF